MTQEFTSETLLEKIRRLVRNEPALDMIGGVQREGANRAGIQARPAVDFAIYLVAINACI